MYFDALRGVDFLIEPTVPSTPARIDGYEAAPAAIADWSWPLLANTSNANVVVFQSISLPFGVGHGLQVGVMITAAPWNDFALLQFAQACESEIRCNPSVTVSEFGVERN
jgi:Asp-tRNA(Asn)/Glu-tRNA(Gln) amidotransferase A subunit family amidase